MYFDPEVWGPHYWFIIHTIAMTYPKIPGSATKKRYYKFYQDLPHFLPLDLPYLILVSLYLISTFIYT